MEELFEQIIYQAIKKNVSVQRKEWLNLGFVGNYLLMKSMKKQILFN